MLLHCHVKVQLCVEEYVWNLSSQWNGLSHLSSHCLLDTFLPISACYTIMEMIPVNNSLLLASIVFSCASSGLSRDIGRDLFSLFSCFWCASLSRFCSVCVLPSDQLLWCVHSPSLTPADMTQWPVVFHDIPSVRFAVECLPRLLLVNSIPWHPLGQLSRKSLESSRKLVVHHLSNFSTIQKAAATSSTVRFGLKSSSERNYLELYSAVDIDCICYSCIL